MIEVTFISADGTERKVSGNPGDTLMQVATDNGIDEIIAECGGACICATCHCYVADEWSDKLTEAGPIEQSMLEMVLEPKPNSRLSCQIDLDESLDGLVVTLPQEQA